MMFHKWTSDAYFVHVADDDLVQVYDRLLNAVDAVDGHSRILRL